MDLMQLFNALELGLIYGLVAIAIFLTFRIINFSDLTVDGSFSLGAAVMSSALSQDMNIFISMLMAILAGVMAGTVTGWLNVRYKIMEILAGILTMSALYSINLRIMGRPNISLMEIGLSDEYRLVILIAVVSIVTGLIMFFLKTQVGLALQAVGANPTLSSSCGINTGRMRILALAISNGLVALSGALFVLMQGFSDISMGVGTVIIGLASVIIGEKLTSSRSTSILILSVIIGAILYRLLITLALNLEVLNLEASDLNLISTLLVMLIMIAPTYYNQWMDR